MNDKPPDPKWAVGDIAVIDGDQLRRVTPEDYATGKMLFVWSGAGFVLPDQDAIRAFMGK